MRLIDADELVRLLKGCTMSNGTLINTNTMLAVIEKQPTAYDVDKVVCELREVTKCNIDCYEGRASEVADYDDSWNDDIISACEALDIVRKGGVNER